MYIRDKLSFFCHVCNNKSGFKIAKNVMRTIFVISGSNRELSGIWKLLLEATLFVTNLLRFTTLKTFNGEYCRCMTNTSLFMEIPSLKIKQFSTAENYTMACGGHSSNNCHRQHVNFATGIHIRVWTNLFCHVHFNFSCLKTVNNATWTSLK